MKISSMKAVALCMIVLVAGCSMTKAANDGISDSEITSGVNAKLGESRLQPYNIAVATNDGVVHLSGNVATGAERDSAEKIASASRGVVRVDNYIQFGRVAPAVQ
jgi:osmotically-inducible protein OsmY